LPPPGKSTARYAVMASLVGDRLWTTLRKSLGATYGFGARVRTLRGGAAHLEITGAVDNAHLGKAMEILQGTLHDLAHGKIAPSEVDLARWRSAREYTVRFQTNESLVRAILKARNEDRDLESIDAYPSDLAAVTAGGLRADFVRCTTEPVVTIVGDEVTVRAALQPNPSHK
jgi:predicted Zn-dependent peptidase